MAVACSCIPADFGNVACLHLQFRTFLLWAVVVVTVGSWCRNRNFGRILLSILRFSSPFANGCYKICSRISGIFGRSHSDSGPCIGRLSPRNLVLVVGFGDRCRGSGILILTGIFCTFRRSGRTGLSGNSTAGLGFFGSIFGKDTVRSCSVVFLVRLGCLCFRRLFVRSAGGFVARVLCCVGLWYLPVHRPSSGNRLRAGKLVLSIRCFWNCLNINFLGLRADYSSCNGSKGILDSAFYFCRMVCDSCTLAFRKRQCPRMILLDDIYRVVSAAWKRNRNDEGLFQNYWSRNCCFG